MMSLYWARYALDYVPYWCFPTWWSYVLNDSKADRDYGTRWSRFVCRWNGHPMGPIFYNAGGFEPDGRCRGCGEDIR